MSGNLKNEQRKHNYLSEKQAKKNRDLLVVEVVEGTLSYTIYWFFLEYCVEVGGSGVLIDTMTGTQCDDLMGWVRWNIGH